MSNDAELLRRYAGENSQPAFAELVRRHVDLVYSVALNKVGRDAHAAQDVAQAVFIALARQARALAGRPSLAGWLYLTTHNQAAQFVRAERRRKNRETQAHTMNEILNTPDVDWDQLRPVLDETLRELSEAEREAILLRYFEGQPFAAIGRAFLVSEDAARMRVDRALEKLRTLLARRGVSSTAAALAGVLGQQVAAAPASLTTAISDAVAGIPVVAGKPFMSLPQIITGGAVIAAVAVSVFIRSNDHRSSEIPGSAPSAAIQPASTASSLSTPVARPIPVPVVDSSRSGPPSSTPPAPQPEVREPLESNELRWAAYARELASYQSLLDKLGLTTEQRTTFNQLLMAHLQRRADLREVGRSQGTRPVDVDIEALEAEADAELLTRVRAAFGAEVQAAFAHFTETGPVREFVHHLSETLAATPTPLSPAQTDQLVEIIARHSRGADGRVVHNPRELAIEAAIADTQNPLSAPQVAALRRLQAELR